MLIDRRLHRAVIATLHGYARLIVHTSACCSSHFGFPQVTHGAQAATLVDGSSEEGGMADEIELVPYDLAWPSMYEAELARLRAGLPASLILAAEHFGSTANPGMPAKPIIDILMAVRSVEEAREIAPKPMTALGYAFWADNPRHDRLFFVRGLPPAPRRTHHVHMPSPEAIRGSASCSVTTSAAIPSRPTAMSPSSGTLPHAMPPTARLIRRANRPSSRRS